jgi:membrane-bound serine protease (ClpP class)
VLGAIFLILAFYSFQTLPVNYAGLLLIGLAIILFILEVKIASYGLLTIGGLVSMTLGSLMLFDSPFPFLKVSLSIVLPTVFFTALLIVAALGLTIKAHRKKAVTGVEGLIGLEGTALIDIDKNGGNVFVHGEIWQAFSDNLIEKNTKILIESVTGLKLKVIKKED